MCLDSLKMGMKVVIVLLLMQCCVHCRKFPPVFGNSPEVLWEQMGKEIQEEEAQRFLPERKIYKGASGDPIEAMEVPEYVSIQAKDDQTPLLKPEQYARPLPDSIRKLLLSPPPTTKHSLSTGKKVDVLCHIDRMYVRVMRDVFTDPDAYQNLKLGSCEVNQGTDEFYYMLYLLKDCGTQMHSDADSVTFSNKVSYSPATKGPVVRELRFNIDLQCRYNRFHLSYTVGFMPSLQGGTVFRALRRRTGVTIGVFGADGKELSPDSGFIIGQPIMFVAKSSSSDEKHRVYVNKCFMTPSHDYHSMPKYTVIDNSGCMVDGKFSDNSKFMPTSSDSTKFTISAFIFEQMAHSSSPMSLYIHCEMTMGPLKPTESAKSCNYVNKKWVEVNDMKSDVCDCCDATCPSAQPSGTKKMIVSHSFEVNHGKGRVVETLPVEVELKTFKTGTTISDNVGFQEYWGN